MLRLYAPVQCCSRSGSLSLGSRRAAPLPCFDLLMGLQICAVASCIVGGGLASGDVVFRLCVTLGWGLLTELPGGDFWSPVGWVCIVANVFLSVVWTSEGSALGSIVMSSLGSWWWWGWRFSGLGGIGLGTPLQLMSLPFFLPLLQPTPVGGFSSGPWYFMLV